ncbi:carbon-nitrogen hydrolase family protein [Mycolicibacterium septicum DSM 44393]|uniref:Carbon-nitrogen hydrolase family protein n=1 Tax=Mycolicibacterium septicum DSM 44393 TaxID=1341646 RepID=A0A7X6RVK2_9MYCO|nr:carbon-nitrogen hydrolase family protein [Mycolicibacterium septicum]NKZ10776.1 carbon-nitrogen hydrolase family protein [Mycolicibacterium septicum DSM 44393]
MSINVAACQFEANADMNYNLDACVRLVEQAARKNAKVVVLPEAAMFTDWSGETSLVKISQPLDGIFVTGLSQVARATNTVVVAGMFELAEGKTYNTTVVIDQSGSTIGTYRKVHLYDAFGFRESDKVANGSRRSPTTFTLGGITFGLLTCYDLRFPEAFRWVVDAGANAVILPAAWVRGPGKETHWRTLLQSRAIENTIYVIGSGQVGEMTCGLSQIVDPAGVVVASAGSQFNDVVTAELNPDRIAGVRMENPSLDNRRFTVSLQAKSDA